VKGVARKPQGFLAADEHREIVATFLAKGNLSGGNF
jgi:hypothetical protein